MFVARKIAKGKKVIKRMEQDMVWLKDRDPLRWLALFERKEQLENVIENLEIMNEIKHEGIHTFM